jgi:hypothetical protein
MTSRLNGLVQIKATSSRASVRRVFGRLHDPAQENELTHDGSRMQRHCVQPAKDAACGSLFPSLSLQEVAPHTPGNSNEAESSTNRHQSADLESLGRLP